MMNNVVSLAEWRRRKEQRQEIGKEELELWLRGSNIIVALDQLWADLYRAGYVSTIEEFHALTVPEALRLRKKAREDHTLTLLHKDE